MMMMMSALVGLQAFVTPRDFDPSWNVMMSHPVMLPSEWRAVIGLIRPVKSLKCLRWEVVDAKNVWNLNNEED